ncbi:hypothetical protein [Actinocatenispora rupis]|uniref:CDP-diglyceride synthetase n=1 Tax=Actinocatenispora rupis TaxID=519421 RepID=A0A8J3JB28_9ACTN|nr:hypothetical protein [Actinocatenispora rupis]GID15152.1 hypothetical protein Aru02nite_60410 [Actinocatenispora rupis]
MSGPGAGPTPAVRFGAGPGAGAAPAASGDVDWFGNAGGAPDPGAEDDGDRTGGWPTTGGGWPSGGAAPAPGGGFPAGSASAPDTGWQSGSTPASGGWQSGSSAASGDGRPAGGAAPARGSGGEPDGWSAARGGWSPTYDPATAEHPVQPARGGDGDPFADLRGPEAPGTAPRPHYPDRVEYDGDSRYSDAPVNGPGVGDRPPYPGMPADPAQRYGAPDRHAAPDRYATPAAYDTPAGYGAPPEQDRYGAPEPYGAPGRYQAPDGSDRPAPDPYPAPGHFGATEPYGAPDRYAASAEPDRFGAVDRFGTPAEPDRSAADAAPDPYGASPAPERYGMPAEPDRGGEQTGRFEALGGSTGYLPPVGAAGAAGPGHGAEQPGVPENAAELTAPAPADRLGAVVNALAAVVLFGVPLVAARLDRPILVAACVLVQVAFVVSLVVGTRRPGPAVVAVVGLGAGLVADWYAGFGAAVSLAPFGYVVAGGLLAAAVGQLARGGGRSRVTDSLASTMYAVIGAVAVPSAVMLTRHEHGVAALTTLLGAAGAGVVVARLIDTVWHSPRASAPVARGVLGVVVGGVVASTATGYAVGVATGLPAVGSAVAGLVMGLAAVLSDIGVSFGSSGRELSGEPRHGAPARFLLGPAFAFAAAAPVAYVLGWLVLLPRT